MNNQVKNNIEFEFYPQKELELDKKGLVVLFKHDYYSSDSVHGRELLSNIIYFLNSERESISKLLFIDSGVFLLNPDYENSTEISMLIEKAQAVYVCSESIEEYIAPFSDKNNIILADAESFFEQLFTLNPDIIIE